MANDHKIRREECIFYWHQPKQQRGNLRVKKEATRTCVEEYKEPSIDEVFTGSDNEFSDEEYIVKFVKERKVEWAKIVNNNKSSKEDN